MITKTRVRELVRRSLTYGYFQTATDTRTYLCPLDTDRDRMAHRITLTYWVGRPPNRADIETAFETHYRDDCPHATNEDRS